MLFAVPTLRADTAVQWLRGAVPGWVPRGVLVAAWAAAFLVGIVFDARPCTPVDPSVCGPEVGWATGASLLLATPVLLVLLPALGCLLGVLAGAYELVAERLLQAQVAFGLHGLACAVVLAWMLRSRQRQSALARTAAGRVALPGPLPPAPRTAFAAAAVLVVAGSGLLLLWHAWTTVDQRHLAAAIRLDAPVVAELDDGYTVRLRLPDRQDEVSVDVVAAAYPAGAVLPVLVDRTGDEPWVALVAEQPDPTFPLSAGLAAGLVALALAGWEVTWRRVPARFAAGAPAVAVLGLLRADEVDLWDADGSAPFARVPVRWAPEDVPDHAISDSDGNWDEDDRDEDGGEVEDGWEVVRAADFGAAWRQPATPPTWPYRPDPVVREPMTAVGDLRQGGWVALVGESGVLWPSGGVRRLVRDDPASDEDDLFRGEPVAAGTGGVPHLPVVLRAPWSARVLGTALLAGFAVGPVASVLLAEGWYQRLLALWLGGASGISGLTRLRVGLRLEPTALTLRGRWHTHVVPWAALHGVRRDGPELRLAWWPDEIMDVGPFAPETGETPESTASRAGDLMMRQRTRALAAGDPGHRVASRWSPAVPAAALYLLVSVAVLVLR